MTRTIGVAIGIPEPRGSELDGHRVAAGDPKAPFIPAHLTLLGPTEVANADSATIDEHLGRVAAQYPPFVLHLRGTGSFRPINQVVFVAVAGGAMACGQLAAAVRSGPLDQPLAYPYHPHVTVAHDVPAYALDLVAMDLLSFEARFAVDKFTLYEHAADGHWRPQRAFPLTGE